MIRLIEREFFQEMTFELPVDNSPTSIMESLCELQNPLLDKTNKHVAGGNYGYQGDFPTTQCQDNIISYFVTGGGGSQAKSHQLLDATSLHLAVEAFYRPNFILCKEESQAKIKDSKGENCETTFTEQKEAEQETISVEDPQAKLLGEGEKEVNIQTVSYDVEEEEYLEYEEWKWRREVEGEEEIDTAAQDTAFPSHFLPLI
ncbi:hypothetical protein JZ751_004845 [Albula glossodonta]|uniref:Uncharacterized protein n=1 Tax=Albula glossodonta TaxID=121402 RepID=A0A8T2PCP9_9TELE|nr:hypothetical protein JZ751_004845 [Albula glossodonta]